MAYIIDKTRFRHSTYGIGTFRGYSSSGIMLLEFPGHGVKQFAESSIRTGHLALVIETPQPQPQPKPIPKPVPQPPVIAPVIQSGSSTQQYDTSDTIIGDKNILEAFDCEDIVLFNESYVVIGEETHARIIRAAYDLTIIGHLSASEIQVNGTLTVTGSLVAQKVNCSNNLICQGNVTADNIYVGGDMIADSIKCSDFLCDGNAVIRTTIDIDNSSRTEKTMVACEGIIGGGTFAAMNAIANEYFEFDGDIEGHIVELETETTLSEVSAPAPVEVVADFSELPIEEALAKISERIRAEYARMEELDEDALLELTQKLSSGSLGELEDMGKLFEQLTQISYKDEIDDLGDYLVIEYAKKNLPSQLYRYETVEHVDSILLPKAAAMLEELEFVPSSVEKIAQSLHIIMQLQGNLPLSTEALCDKVFSSVGLRFATVKSIMSRVGTPKAEAPAEKEEVFDVIVEPEAIVPAPVEVTQEEDGYRPNPAVALCTSQDEFLAKPLSVIGKSFTMTNDEVIRLGSVRIRTVGDFLAVDTAFIKDLYKKKPFLAHHLISVWKKIKAANKHIT